MKPGIQVPVTVILLALLVGLTSGCSPKPPIKYQQLQVQDLEEAQDWDIYMNVAVQKGLQVGEVIELLEWFRDVKFADVNKIKIFVWDNPQSALMVSMGDRIATLTVDRESSIYEIDTVIN